MNGSRVVIFPDSYRIDYDCFSTGLICNHSKSPDAALSVFLIFVRILEIWFSQHQPGSKRHLHLWEPNLERTQASQYGND
ncbi:hypothetical protein OGCDGJMD_00468 [Cyanobium usitatum str. Tous]|nr:hypothetical protein OGCDGJMD_00468 [Cyanobium usitatum str. Tous]